MGVFAVIGVVLLFVSAGTRNGKLALFAVVMFGVGVAGDQWMNAYRFCK